MILFAILTGVLAVFVWRKHIGWAELLILCSWGLLCAGTHLGATYLVPFLQSLSAHTAGWL